MTEKTNTKTQVLLAILAGIFVIVAAIISSPHWFKYFFPKHYLEQEKLDPKKIENTKVISDSINTKSLETKEKAGIEDIVISKIELCPKNFRIPNYLYFEVQNKGTKTIKNLVVSVNLGKASYLSFDYTRNLNPKSQVDSLDKSFIKVICPEIKESEGVGIYLLLTQPNFEDILLHADNLTFDKQYSYSEYLSSSIQEDSDNFHSFLIVCLSIVIIIFGIYFTVVIITYLNKLFKVE